MQTMAAAMIFFFFFLAGRRRLRLGLNLRFRLFVDFHLGRIDWLDLFQLFRFGFRLSSRLFGHTCPDDEIILFRSCDCDMFEARFCHFESFSRAFRRA